MWCATYDKILRIGNLIWRKQVDVLNGVLYVICDPSHVWLRVSLAPEGDRVFSFLERSMRGGGGMLDVWCIWHCCGLCGEIIIEELLMGTKSLFLG